MGLIDRLKGAGHTVKEKFSSGAETVAEAAVVPPSQRGREPAGQYVKEKVGGMFHGATTPPSAIEAERQEAMKEASQSQFDQTLSDYYRSRNLDDADISRRIKEHNDAAATARHEKEMKQTGAFGRDIDQPDVTPVRMKQAGAQDQNADQRGQKMAEAIAKDYQARQQVEERAAEQERKGGGKGGQGRGGGGQGGVEPYTKEINGELWLFTPTGGRGGWKAQKISTSGYGGYGAYGVKLEAPPIESDPSTWAGAANYKDAYKNWRGRNKAKEKAIVQRDYYAGQLAQSRREAFQAGATSGKEKSVTFFGGRGAGFAKGATNVGKGLSGFGIYTGLAPRGGNTPTAKNVRAHGYRPPNVGFWSGAPRGAPVKTGIALFPRPASQPSNGGGFRGPNVGFFSIQPRSNGYNPQVQNPASVIPRPSSFLHGFGPRTTAPSAANIGGGGGAYKVGSMFSFGPRRAQPQPQPAPQQAQQAQQAQHQQMYYFSPEKGFIPIRPQGSQGYSDRRPRIKKHTNFRPGFLRLKKAGRT